LTNPTEPDALADLEQAMRAQPVITRPEDLAPEDIPQIPNVQFDRVPEAFLTMEAYVVGALAELQGQPVTRAMLRMMRGATVPATADPDFRIALFEVLATDGGEVTGWLAAWDGPSGPHFRQEDTLDAATTRYNEYVERFAEAVALDAAFEAKPNECRACPDGCNDCTKDADCECYEHGTTYVDPQ